MIHLADPGVKGDLMALEDLTPKTAFLLFVGFCGPTKERPKRTPLQYKTTTDLVVSMAEDETIQEG